ncbi:radical SAM/SPASM domain-containing protein [Rhizomonospora bruguierae]|uniref:radical SAM/SPASM domain-containing protein n=1 Tax=Rhizomonospora bruguierae TaxID=1581705 RepID=UPI001BCB06AA|nr:radical SAM protein [Micromonospora sp. NBRC 107566]
MRTTDERSDRGLVPEDFRRFLVADDFARYGLTPDRHARSPQYIQLELTDRCNLACAGCVRAVHASTGSEFGYDAFVALLADLPDLLHVSFVGAGEALIVRDLPRHVAACTERNVFTSCNTNGLLVRRRLRPALDAGLGLIALSVDGADEETLSDMRSGLRLSQLTTALREAVLLVAETGARISAAVTLSARNVASFPDIVSYIADQGVREITVESLHHWGNDKSLNGESLFALDPAGVVPMIEAGLAEAVRRDLKLTIFDYSRLWTRPERLLCPWPWDSMYITCNGEVTPCCVHIEADGNNVVGNVREALIAEIWDGRPLLELRSLLRRGGGWDSCLDCVYRKEFGRVI